MKAPWSPFASLFASPLAFSLAAVLGLGCSSSDSPREDGDNDEATQRAAESCPQDKYEEAMAHYKNAIDAANARQTGGACATSATSLRSIANEATVAVLKCPDVKAMIKMSRSAEPLRQALASSLTLKSLTDELHVLRDSTWQNWTGVENLLPGTTMATEPQGSVGAHQAIVFKADGEAIFVTTALNVWQSPATYTVTKKGSDREPRAITITHEGKTETFNLVIDTPDGDMVNAPLFRLVSEEHTNAWQTFNSLVKECP